MKTDISKTAENTGRQALVKRTVSPETTSNLTPHLGRSWRPENQVLSLQRVSGNRSVDQWLSQQSDPSVSESGDAVEREAEQMAATALNRWSDRTQSPRARMNNAEVRGAGATNLQVHAELEPVARELRQEAGQALTPDLKGTFEKGFGQELPNVRLHAGSEAANLAQRFDARALTIGSDIVFGAGEYQPTTQEGQKLLAHEMAHVAQSARGDLGSEPTILRKGKKKKRQRNEAKLREMAVWPANALRSWNRLSSEEQRKVVKLMTETYGGGFATRFMEYAKGSRKPNLVTDTVLTSHRPNITPEYLRERDFKFVGSSPTATGNLQYWVHPSGHELIRFDDAGSRNSEPNEESVEPESENESQLEEEVNPSQLDLSTDSEDKYGPEIDSRDDAEVSMAEGFAILYADGTIEVFQEGFEDPITYRPVPGSTGLYNSYNRDGQKTGSTVSINPAEIFDLDEE